VWWLAIGCGRDVFFGTETGGGDTGGGDSAIVARFERGRADLAPRSSVDVVVVVVGAADPHARDDRDLTDLALHDGELLDDALVADAAGSR
jgi:hypothetical protein